MIYCASPGSPGFGSYRNGFHIAYPASCVSYYSEDFNEDENKDSGRKIHDLVPCQALQEEQSQTQAARAGSARFPPFGSWVCSGGGVTTQ